ncbi:MAG TPA: glycosyltransferase family A protein, partial [Terriglobia bacterium]|nr:glycosyltransferase family A protein [Terriglobia bacterium]
MTWARKRVALGGGVTVVTVTRRRPKLLARCIKSVESQDYQGTLKHLIVVDDCRETVAFLAGLNGNGAGRLHWVPAKRLRGESSGPPRLAKLRNLAARLVDTAWTAFLDDDNEY